MFAIYILHPELPFSIIRPRTTQTQKRASSYDDFVYLTYLSILSQVFKVWRVDAFRVHKSLKEFITPLHPFYLMPFLIYINYDFKSHNQLDRFDNIIFNKRKS